VRVCLLIDRRGHPVLEATARELVDRHDATVTVVDAQASPPPDDADVYLLKSRSDRGIEAARRAEVHGALVINSARATKTCLDRKLMAARMSEAGLPFPKTLSAATLDALIASSNEHELAWPVIVKSRRSRRGDLVRVVRARAELHSLAAEWGNEPVIVQRVVRHNGCEHKLWSVCHRLHAVRRSTAVGPRARGLDIPVSLEQLPEGVKDLARAVGATFGLELYGVDVLITDGGPVAVDVNPFPGFRGVPGAAQAIAEQVIGLLAVAKGHP
jgi:ribosomal protein S6--L-glutamate ligase